MIKPMFTCYFSDPTIISEHFRKKNKQDIGPSIETCFLATLHEVHKSLQLC